MSFLVSIYGNGKMLIDRLSLGLGLVLTPLFALAKFDHGVVRSAVFWLGRSPMSSIVFSQRAGEFRSRVIWPLSRTYSHRFSAE